MILPAPIGDFEIPDFPPITAKVCHETCVNIWLGQEYDHTLLPKDVRSRDKLRQICAGRGFRKLKEAEMDNGHGDILGPCVWVRK